MALGGKGPGLVIAVAGKPKPSEGDASKGGSAACRALAKVLGVKDEDYDEFAESLDLVIDERVNGGDESADSGKYDDEE